MAITIDTTLSGANANSYVTLAEAEAYFANKYNNALWTAITDNEKKKALLIDATERIDQEKYAGDRVDTTTPQALEFPRINLPLVDGIDYNNVIPIGIKKATYLLAYHLISIDMNTIGKQNEAMKRVKVEGIEVEYDTDDNSKNTSDYNELPPYVQEYLNDFSNSYGYNIFISR